MQIGVLADSHLQIWPPALLARVGELFSRAELILHAGDIINLSILESLPLPVVAVAGNSDSLMIKSALPLSRTVELNGFKIGLIHGYGPPAEVPHWVRAYFAAEQVDAIVFGHSHVPWLETKDGVLMFNPGPLSGLRGCPSLGRLTLTDRIKAEIIRL
jgi:putative phosphoesterase